MAISSQPRVRRTKPLPTFSLAKSIFFGLFSGKNQQGEMIMTGFDKLRLTAAKTLAVAALATGLATGAASAKPYNLNKDGNVQIQGAGVNWYVSNFTSATSGSGEGFGISYASFESGGNPFSALACLYVDNHYQEPDGIVDISSTAAGTTVKADEAKTKQGLTIRASYFFSKKAPLVRSIFYVRNTTSKAITTTVYVDNGFYTESLLGSSDGNTTFDLVNDRYVVVPGRPLVAVTPLRSRGSGAVTFYRYGTGNVSKPTANQTRALYNGGQQYDGYDVTIAPGKTVAYMTIYVLTPQSKVAGAVNAAKDPKFNSLATLLAAGYLADVPIPDLLNLANWKF
jgi:hypothetical protein